MSPQPEASSASLPCAGAFDLIDQPVGHIHLSQRFHDRAGMYAHSPRLLIGVGEIEAQRLNNAIEDNPAVLAALVGHRAATVAADDVGRANKIERRILI